MFRFYLFFFYCSLRSAIITSVKLVTLQHLPLHSVICVICHWKVFWSIEISHVQACLKVISASPGHWVKALFSLLTLCKPVVFSASCLFKHVSGCNFSTGMSHPVTGWVIKESRAQGLDGRWVLLPVSFTSLFPSVESFSHPEPIMFVGMSRILFSLGQMGWQQKSTKRNWTMFRKTEAICSLFKCLKWQGFQAADIRKVESSLLLQAVCQVGKNEVLKICLDTVLRDMV